MISLILIVWVTYSCAWSLKPMHVIICKQDRKFSLGNGFNCFEIVVLGCTVISVEGVPVVVT